MAGRVAVVPPRFGPGVVGGSEAVSREVAVGLAARGWDVEVLTTCATNHYTWGNDLPPGASWEDGLVVRRFPTVPQYSEVGRRAQLQIQDDEIPSLDRQVSWLGWRFTVPALHEHLIRRGHEYDALLFSPYLFWTTTVCLPVVADRAISMPCLHDETYARLDVVRPTLSGAARLWFLSEPEHQLAHRLGPLSGAHTVTGAGVDVPAGYHPERFRRRYQLDRPFLLYAGRREPEKGWDWLVGLYRQVLAAGVDVDLVSIGVGDIGVPEDLTGRLIDIGRITDDERNDALAAAAAYVQPSRMESFSRTIMEAWLAGTPVLAVRDSEVVAWHCRRSEAGLLFDDARSLTAALRQVLEDPSAAAELGARGRAYVLDNYRWDVVLDRMEGDLLDMGLESPAAAGAGPAVAPLLAEPVPPAAPPPPPTGRVLVVGSYPPVPAAGAAATRQLVDELLAAGRDPVVASPRISAAPLHVAVVGMLAGRRLAHLRRATGARDVIIVAERGMPFPVDGMAPAARRVAQAVTARALARELARFVHVRIVVVGDAGAGVDPRAWAALTACASEVTPAVAGEEAVPPLEADELTPTFLARRVAGAAARRLLGPYAPRARATLVRAVRTVRRRAGSR